MENKNNISQSVVAIVVSHNPEAQCFEKLLEAIIPQVDFAIVVDNASKTDIASMLSRWKEQGLELIEIPHNLGLAAAQNIGIERAIELKADYIYLSDQDSVPENGLITKLLYAIHVEGELHRIGAVGPTTVDYRTGLSSFFVIERSCFPVRWHPSTDIIALPSSIDVSFLIASGTLIPIGVIKHIGAMRSNYFIDHVDTEWCFRAKDAGYRLLGVPNAKLTHQLGDAVKRVWFFGSRQVMYHSALRDYYMFRNTLLMMSDTKMSFIWRTHFLWRLLQFASYFLLFGNDRRGRLKMMVLGLVHGVLRVSGRLDEGGSQCTELPVSVIESAIKKV